MLLLRLPELTLTRPVRVLHPRLPVYVVPRGAGVYHGRGDDARER